MQSKPLKTLKAPLRSAKRFAKRIARRFRASPFEKDRKPGIVVHGTYHKSGTVWFAGVLKAVCKHYGLNYLAEFPTYDPTGVPRDTDVYLNAHSAVDLDTLASFGRIVGSHMIRDPRDVLVSGYNYHLWTEEPWANVPFNESGDFWGPRGFELPPEHDPSLSYKQLLNSLDTEAGYALEMAVYKCLDFPLLTSWDYDDPRFFEIKYEDIMGNESPVFYDMFRFYGFTEDAARTATEIAEQFSFKKRAKRNVGEVESKTHLRSGKSGQWRELPEPTRALMREMLGETLIRLGYEKDLDWS